MENKDKEIVRFTEGNKKVRGNSSDLSFALMGIFKDHIGKDNAILKDDLFELLFNKPYDRTDFGDYLRWSIVGRTMNYLRKYSNCFIVSKQTNFMFSYYVLNSIEDANHYIKCRESTIKKMRTLEMKALEIVKNKLYELPFDLGFKQELLEHKNKEDDNK
jgi:hypothetical protein